MAEQRDILIVRCQGYWLQQFCHHAAKHTIGEGRFLTVRSAEQAEGHLDLVNDGADSPNWVAFDVGEKAEWGESAARAFAHWKRNGDQPTKLIATTLSNRIDPGDPDLSSRIYAPRLSHREALVDSHSIVTYMCHAISYQSQKRFRTQEFEDLAKTLRVQWVKLFGEIEQEIWDEYPTPLDLFFRDCCSGIREWLRGDFELPDPQELQTCTVEDATDCALQKLDEFGHSTLNPLIRELRQECRTDPSPPAPSDGQHGSVPPDDDDFVITPRVRDGDDFAVTVTPRGDENIEKKWKGLFRGRFARR